jgi:phage RecT family recombinase
MNEVATTQQRQTHPVVAFKKDLEAFVTRELETMDDKSRARLKSAAITAITKDSDLLLADRQSFMGELRRCANYGVLPDGVEATLQIYNTKVKDSNGQERWIKKVTLLPMIRGIINRVIRSGKVKLFYAEVVYESEEFRIDASQGGRRPVHEYDPLRRGDDKDIIGAYSVAEYKDGTIDCEPMPRSDIMKVRNAAKTKNVWDGWFSEKAKVAVMKRHAKRLPLSADDLDFIMNRDETDFDREVRDVTPEPEAPPKERVNLAQRIQNPEPEGALDGEVMPPEDENQAGPDDTSLEYAMGQTAARDGASLNECPYEQGTQEWLDWAGGWNAAKESGDE